MKSIEQESNYLARVFESHLSPFNKNFENECHPTPEYPDYYALHFRGTKMEVQCSTLTYEGHRCIAQFVKGHEKMSFENFIVRLIKKTLRK